MFWLLRRDVDANPPIRQNSSGSEIEALFYSLDALGLPIDARLYDGEVAMDVGDAVFY
jgi:hypothetical protein